MPKPIKARAKERLQRALDAIPGLKQAKYDSPEFEKWERDTKVAIDYAFEGSPSKTQDFAAIRYSPFAFVAGATSDFQRPYVRGLESAAAVLQSMIEEIEEYWEEDGDQEPTSSKVPEILERTNTNEVFMHRRFCGPLWGRRYSNRAGSPLHCGGRHTLVWPGNWDFTGPRGSMAA